MKYRDVIQFEPLTTVVQFQQAGERDRAADLVATYVISPRMAETLATLVFPQLQFERPADQKGLFIVGNYGTGKSHLLAVITALAERADLVPVVQNEAVREAAGAIAGKFQVVRMELGATEMRLRDIVVAKLEEALASWGIAYRFPPMTEVSNTKEPLLAMLAAFGERFPDQGLLLAVDELLDYLRGRDSQALILDLGFLREVGEVCADSRLRFVAGIQESLFDSPAFQFAASQVRRVKDRFEQVLISREDVSYVVAHRLLRKSAAQRERVRAYLQPFAPLYPDLATRLESYVELFPVHPAYLRVFGDIFIVEKREILKTLEREMAARLEDEVPADHPGLITYDSYWAVLRANPSFRSLPDVREVMDKSEVLEAKVEAAYTRPAYKPVALRIIHALSVHRLITADLRAPLGVTAAELRDDLCLYLPTPEPDAEFLESTIGAALKEISRTVSGQFLSFNPENGQWYLDVRKDVDYDALIAQRADVLSADQLDRAYYEALANLLEVADVDVHATGFQIWEYEVLWPEHQVTRPGYLFFGAPNQRSTAQPPREFYLYFPQPFNTPVYRDQRLADEVFFRLARKDERLERALRLYAAASALAAEASSAAKPVFREKATSTNPQRPGYLQQVLGWLREHAATAFDVTYQGATAPAVERLRGRAASVRELVDGIASACLAPHFRDERPDYPTFPIRITRENRQATAQEAVRWIAGSLKTKQGAAALSALELLDGDRLAVERSRYARRFRDQLRERGEGKVLNRADLIDTIYQGQVEYDRYFKLEPEWVAVVLVALVHTGELTMALPGRKIDAGSLEQAASAGIEALAHFSYVEPPRGLPLAALTALFELLALSVGLIRDPAQHRQAVQELQRRAGEELERVMAAQQALAKGLVCWNATVVEGTEREETLAALERYRAFLDGLHPLNTPGKLQNFGLSAEQVRALESARAALAGVEALQRFLGDLQPLTAYLLQAATALPTGDPLAQEVTALQEEQLRVLRDAGQRGDTNIQAALLRAAQELKARAIAAYLAQHARARLTLDQDRRRAALLGSPALLRLRALRNVSVLSSGALAVLAQDLIDLVACAGCSAADLATSPVCPHCHLRPADEAEQPPAAARLDALERKLEQLETDWTTHLLQNLDDPTVAETLSLLSAEERRPLDRLCQAKRLPETVDGALVQALESAFRGLDRVVIRKDDLLASLANGGAPSTPRALRERLEALLAEHTKGRDAERVRIVVE